MSKTRQKTHSRTEHLEGLLKAEKSKVRQLRKRLKELERRSHFYEDIVEEAAKDVKVKNTCPLCKKGQIKILDLKHVKYETCDSKECEYRKKI